MNRNSTSKQPYVLEKINNKVLVERFNKSKIPKRHRCLGKRIRDRKLSQADYTKIVEKFFDIYYNELYFLNRPTYFFLGGKMEKVATKSGVRKTTIGRKRVDRYVEEPISLSWSGLSFLNLEGKQIVYKKTKGSTSKTAKIEREWKKNNNYYSLKQLEK